MRWHEIANTPGEKLLKDSQVEELLQAMGDIRLSTAGCSHRQQAVLGARPAARPLPDRLPDQKAPIL